MAEIITLADYDKYTDEIIQKTKEQADEYIRENIDPVAKIGNPEKIIGKPYKFWDELDREVLRRIYVYSPEDLQTFINKKEVEKLWEMAERTRKLEVM